MHLTRFDGRHDPRQDAGRHDLPLGADRHRADDREQRGDPDPDQHVDVTITSAAPSSLCHSNALWSRAL